jgi:hypothetical protein
MIGFAQLHGSGLNIPHSLRFTWVYPGFHIFFGASAALGHQDGGFPPPALQDTYFRGFFTNGNVPLKSAEIECPWAGSGEVVNASGS